MESYHGVNRNCIYTSISILIIAQYFKIFKYTKEGLKLIYLSKYVLTSDVSVATELRLGDIADSGLTFEP